MNKELFVSSTPHETKVGLVEDDLLAEIYLERENEYTLAGSIYKGRVTRVLPGMQSAFVDIGLERDAFLYVSDFMELEEHDEDLTDVVPANRAVQDLRAPAGQAAPHQEGEDGEGPALTDAGEGQPVFEEASSVPGEHDAGGRHASPAGAGQESLDGGGRDGADRERGGFRGRRRRRGGRRDGRGDGRNEGRSEGRSEARNDGRERSSETRFARPSMESAPAPVAPRAQESGRSQQFGPPAGYQPILLPGESISKYRGLTQAPAAQERHSARIETEAGFTSATSVTTPAAPVAATFPDDEPIFANASASASASASSSPASEAPIAEKADKRLDDSRHLQEHTEAASSAASTSVDWNREFRRQELASAAASTGASDARQIDEEFIEEGDEMVARPEYSDRPVPAVPEPLAPGSAAPIFATPGTLEEETIEEEEADTVRYEESSDEGYDEFEEETRAAGQSSSIGREISEVRETVDEIHMSSLEDAGVAPPTEGSAAEIEEDTEELELEEAQAEAEALLDAEARGTGAVDARAEVRAPAGTAGYTQRAPRPRPGFDRQRGGRRGGGRRFPRREAHEVPKISDLLKEGQEILVQIAKEPIGKKGARITSHIALPGRFLVYMPTVNHTGVSRKIASDEERQRLKRIVMSERENGHGGFIVRTAAQNAGEDELRADIRFLKGLWNDIKTRSEASKPPALIYHDLNVVERVLRDQVTSDFSVIWVDTEPEYERILRFFNRFQPGLVKRVKLFTKETPLFEQFGLKEEMDKALKSKVWLKSGGYIVINQTEALVAIDINTGKYVGKTSRLEDTIVKTNVDAIKEIVRQIRLRDLGGIIIIDFIDMDERRNRQRVMQALEEELRHDRAPSKVLQFNDFGLVAITRKRVKQSLERTIGAPCPYCQSTGYVKSLTTVANEIYVEMRKIAKHLEHEDVMLRVNPDVAKELKANNGRLLNEMEELTKRTIIVKSDPALHQEQFDIN
jgi:Rne/Rng family ribonuclease